jgi:2-polyprenyl-3-methyl-5-hydroxy-6-metoxy-1,4-benzoquinol methylase
VPTSDFHNISSIVGLIFQFKPTSVLDIGCGFGKYGVLIREYLDVWERRLDPDSWCVKLVGIEAFDRYRNPIYDYVYSEVHFGEAQRIVPTLGQFDLVLMADVIEHLEKEQARNLMRECLERSKVVVVSTPTEFAPQDDILGNSHEVHRSCWTRDDFPSGTHVHSIRMVSCDIFVASRTPLEQKMLSLTDPVDYVYIRSRVKLGWIGLPLSLGLRLLCRLLS